MNKMIVISRGGPCELATGGVEYSRRKDELTPQVVKTGLNHPLHLGWAVERKGGWKGRGDEGKAIRLAWKTFNIMVDTQTRVTGS